MTQPCAGNVHQRIFSKTFIAALFVITNDWTRFICETMYAVTWHRGALGEQEKKLLVEQHECLTQLKH